jgi:hypothetical protein
MDKKAPVVDVCFNGDTLRRLFLPRGESVEGEVVLICDYARTSGLRSDETAILAAKVSGSGVAKCYTVLDVISDHWSVVEVPYQLVMAAKRFSAQRIYIERLQSWELIQAEMVRLAKLHGVNLGRVTFFKVDKTPLAKLNRLRKLHRLCEARAVRFTQANYINKLFHQLENLAWTKTNKCRVDDNADVLALLVTHS